MSGAVFVSEGSASVPRVSKGAVDAPVTLRTYGKFAAACSKYVQCSAQFAEANVDDDGDGSASEAVPTED
jgi:hypothetical protein